MAKEYLVTVLVALLAMGTSCGQPERVGPSDALSTQQRADLEAANSSAVTVAVLDAGVDAEHPALRGRVSRSWRASGLSPAVNAHGTQMAGIIGGRATTSYLGGLAPAATLLDVQVLDGDGDGTGQPADLAAGLSWADSVRAGIVVTSLALEQDDPQVRAAVAALVKQGVVVIAASGNGFADVAVYPASYPGVLSVSAHDRRGQRVQLASWASADAVAPGSEIWAPSADSGYEAVSGTSVAAAMAAGLIAACADHRPMRDGHLSPDWTDNNIDFDGRALPRATCPGPLREQGS